MTNALARQADAAFVQGYTLHQHGRRQEARALYERALKLQPGHFHALQLLGTLALEAGEPERACDLIARSILTQPQNAVAHFNQGVAQCHLQRYAQALESFERARRLSYREPDLDCHRAGALHALRRFEEAVASYDAALAQRAGYVEALVGRGASLYQLHRLEAAVQSFVGALALDPRIAEAHNNRANVLIALRRHEEALAGYDAALALQPRYADAWYNRGNALRELARYEAAVESYDRAMALGMSERHIRGVRRYAMMQSCDWRELDADVRGIVSGIEAGTLVTNPFFLLPIIDSPAVLLKAAEIWCIEESGVSPHAAAPAAAPAPRAAPPVPCTPLSRPEPPARIRVGYFSADFHEHATMHLLAGLFEMHDRERFEITAFSFGPDIDDEMRRRLRAACEHFVDVREADDGEVARVARERGLDIAVDLKGYTEGARPGIFARRAAPSQIGFLGFPGTLGAHHMDYLVADRMLVPPGAERFYRERLILMPDSYQVNDSRRAPVGGSLSREQVRLPESGFVFCCFNNNYKITPDAFGSWMRILQRTPGSVLWLLEDNPSAARALRREAQARGVSPERLVFAPRVGQREHLERHAAADLVLDTFPCNAHTTASDALWAGTPLLTRRGEGFASRVAASLLAAVGLAELITTSPQDYEEAAVRIALDAALSASLKERLVANRARAPLFDTHRFTRRLEAAYVAAFARQLAGEAPDHLDIEDAR
jgi:predicted O-linked N-acetylglucosamine transferase (SPINDLY family)